MMRPDYILARTPTIDLTDAEREYVDSMPDGYWRDGYTDAMAERIARLQRLVDAQDVYILDEFPSHDDVEWYEMCRRDCEQFGDLTDDTPDAQVARAGQET
jgi:hypothetical protein